MLGEALREALAEIADLDPHERRRARREKFRSLGVYATPVAG
jgi:hypothetical protein